MSPEAVVVINKLDMAANAGRRAFELGKRNKPSQSGIVTSLLEDESDSMGVEIRREFVQGYNDAALAALADD
jgi:hypothetical protein